MGHTHLLLHAFLLVCLIQYKVLAERYITLKIDNKVGRDIRVEPSRGRKGGYIVPTNAFLKVTMIFPTLSEPVIFVAEDLETENVLEINGDANKVSITPGEFPDEVINMTITAPAPKIKTIHSWFMISLKDSRVSDSSINDMHPNSTQEIPGDPDLKTYGNLSLVDGGLAFDGHGSYAVAQIGSDDCVINTEKCADGLSLGTKLKFDNTEDNEGPRYIADTGASLGMRGFTLFKQKDKLFAVVRSADREWKVQSSALMDDWVYVMVTWNKLEGIKMYYNAQLRVHDTTGKPVTTTTDNPYNDNFVIGREVGNDGPFHHAKFSMASLKTFAEVLSQDDVNAAYIFFWSGLSASFLPV